MFSLCIPTIDRFDTFLKGYLEEYLKNPLISEILICDENGNDYEKIKEHFPTVKVFKNETVLGPFLNKIKTMELAKCEWIVLMDSDNFANQEYFNVAKDYIENNTLSDLTILSPDFAKPNFNFKKYSGKVFTPRDYIDDPCLINLGNYILNKSILKKLNISRETENIKKSSSCDVIFFNTLLFEQMDLHFHVVPNLEYTHVVHDGSIYRQTSGLFMEFNNSIYNRYRSIKRL
jgi:hypothetical protein